MEKRNAEISFFFLSRCRLIAKGGWGRSPKGAIIYPTVIWKESGREREREKKGNRTFWMQAHKKGTRVDPGCTVIASRERYLSWARRLHWETIQTRPCDYSNKRADLLRVVGMTFQ
ncbi:hypothetical protein CEXT_435061 [Caerostris extrusa]|uniref:Uncharacterized protein n=1 Tax=Caerostris extrusa TaxID=172846 RepID=A0AAV4RRV2_CAEEX|nr:hypothetical protein CEXT_435061 [Caerostris extrusa]